MRIIQNFTVAVTSLLFLSSLAYADDPQVYVGLEGGYNKPDSSSTSVYTPEGFASAGASSTFTSSNNSYGAINIGLLFPAGNDWYFGGQIGFADYGKMTDTTTANVSENMIVESLSGSSVSVYDETLQALTIQAVAQKYIGQFFFNLHGGLAEMSVDQKATQTMTLSGQVGGIPVNETLNTNMSDYNGTEYVPAAIAGLELGYQFSEHFNVYTTYNHIFGTGDMFEVPDMNSVGLGVNYIF